MVEQWLWRRGIMLTAKDTSLIPSGYLTIFSLWGGSIAQWLAHFLPDPADQGLTPSVLKNFQRNKLSILLRLINGAAQRKVDSGSNILIKPIKNWLVASQCYNIQKKTIFSFSSSRLLPISSVPEDLTFLTDIFFIRSSSLELIYKVYKSHYPLRKKHYSSKKLRGFQLGEERLIRGRWQLKFDKIATY